MTLKHNRIVSLFLCCCLLGGNLARANVVPETQEQHDARMEWWREARFGMFIHWGLYSVAGGKWDGKPAPRAGEWIQYDMKIPTSQYESLVPQFNPVKFDARRWAHTAKEAGMKYLVITSKHHEGFCMFPTELTDWCISATPFHRDPLMELSKACKAEGIKFGVYYSILDWHHPDWGNRPPFNDVAKGEPDMDRYVAYMKVELKELITRYHPAVLWFDGEWEDPWTHERAVDLAKFLRGLDPKLIINNRIDKARNGMDGLDKWSGSVGDYGTPEQTIPQSPPAAGIDWESCMTMNDTWGYKASDNNWKPARLLIQNLIEIASEGGNYLLNVGPTGEGVIPEASIARLEEMGRWLKLNGEAIYGTQASPFHYPLHFGACTSKKVHKDTMLYLHVFRWPNEGKIVTPGVRNRVLSAKLWTDKKKISLDFGKDGPDVIITLPKFVPSDKNPMVIALRIEGEPDIHDPPPAPFGKRAVRKSDGLRK